MTDYTKELEAHIESLKAALDKERDWNDFLEKRRLSQKYRRWCVRFTASQRNVPTEFIKNIPLEHCYSEYVLHTLDDARNMMRYVFENSIESFYGKELPKIHRTIKRKGGIAPVINFRLTICLFNQIKDREEFAYGASFDMSFYGEKFGVRLSNVTGLQPNQIRELDEMILPLLIDNDEYLNKWGEATSGGIDGRIRKTPEGRKTC